MISHPRSPKMTSRIVYHSTIIFYQQNTELALKDVLKVILHWDWSIVYYLFLCKNLWRIQKKTLCARTNQLQTRPMPVIDWYQGHSVGRCKHSHHSTIFLSLPLLVIKQRNYLGLEELGGFRRYDAGTKIGTRATLSEDEHWRHSPISPSLPPPPIVVKQRRSRGVEELFPLKCHLKCRNQACRNRSTVWFCLHWAEMMRVQISRICLNPAERLLEVQRNVWKVLEIVRTSMYLQSDLWSFADWSFYLIYYLRWRVNQKCGFYIPPKMSLLFLYPNSLTGFPRFVYSPLSVYSFLLEVWCKRDSGEH